MNDINIKPCKMYYNGYEIGTGDFSFEDVESAIKEQKYDNLGNITISGTITISLWSRIKIKLWLWKESFKTQTYNFTLKGTK